MPKRVLVLGAGGREHALAWRLSRDPEPADIVVAPGNPGMARAFRCLALDPTDPDAVVAACRAERIDLVVIGPEQPLAAGVADALAAAGTAVFGPTRAAARIETSKAFAKEIMAEANVPTAACDACDRPDTARAAIARRSPPYVVKADGLAAGKGVLVSTSRAEAEAFALACLSGSRFGAAGARVLIEDHLAGEEVSMMAVCDGSAHVLLPAARDHKRARDGDVGPNTGGMGAVVPAPTSGDRRAGTTRDSEALAAEVSARIVTPVLESLARLGTPFRGVLYAGLMLTPAGPQVLEFNARFGDPETEAVLPTLNGSMVRLLASAAAWRLDPRAVMPADSAAVAVAIVDERYPDSSKGGGVIAGLASLEARGGLVFHAGTAWVDEEWHVRGGRAAYVVGRGASRDAARTDAYASIATLGGSGWRCRHDIGATHAAADAPVP